MKSPTNKKDKGNFGKKKVNKRTGLIKKEASAIEKKDPNFKKKKVNKRTGLIKKESSSQEEANLMGENPVDNRAATMKKGKAYAKKTGSYKSAEMHYMENELHNKKTGHDVAASYDKKKLGSILSKHMSRNK